MGTHCTRCDGTGFLNLEQLGDEFDFWEAGDHDAVLRWIRENEGHDVCVCDCCGDGEGWWDVPGEHTGEGRRNGDPFQCR